MKNRLKNHWIIALVLTMTLCANAEAKVRYDDYKALSVSLEDDSQRAVIEGIDGYVLFGDVLIIGKNQILVPGDAVPLLDQAGIEYVVQSDNYQDYLDAMDEARAYFSYLSPSHIGVLTRSLYSIAPTESLPSAGGGGTSGYVPVLDNNWYRAYRTYDEVVQKLNAFVAEFNNVDDLQVTMESIGVTFEGRDIWALHIIKPSAKPKYKPALLLNAGIHAAERVGVGSLLYGMEAFLVGYAEGDQRAWDVMNSVDFYLIPLLNPDGYQRSMDTDNLMVRKNQRDYQNTTYTTAAGTSIPYGACSSTDIQRVGVELNRNFSHGWCTASSSSYISEDHCAREFCGPEPFSEIETQAFKQFVDAHQNIRGYVDFHGYARWLLHPWVASSDDLPQEEIYADLNQQMRNAIYSVHGLTFEGNDAEGAYNVGGSSMDWAYAAHAIWSFTIEVRPKLDKDTYPDHFAPDLSVVGESFIIESGEETLEGVLVLAEWLGGDEDFDGVPNGSDNCPRVANFPQRDCDGDNIGDACEVGETACDYDTFIVLDHSSSMWRTDGYSGYRRGQHAASGAAAYLYNSFYFPGSQNIGFVEFNDNAACMIDGQTAAQGCALNLISEESYSSAPASDVENSKAALYSEYIKNNYTANGATDIIGAVDLALDGFVNGSGLNQTVYLLSDGQQTVINNIQPVLDRISSSFPNVTISALAVTEEADVEKLAAFTDATGGKIGFAHDADGIPVYWHDVVAKDSSNPLGVLDGPSTIYSPGQIVIPVLQGGAGDNDDDGEEGERTFRVSEDATGFFVMLTSRGDGSISSEPAPWNVNFTLRSESGLTVVSTATVPAYWGYYELDENTKVVYITDPESGEWTLSTSSRDTTRYSSNYIISELNPKAMVYAESDSTVVEDGGYATVTPDVVYDGVPLDVNTTNCSVTKVVGPENVTIFANDASAFTLENTAERIEEGLPPYVEVTPFNGLGFYTVYIQCAVDDTASPIPGTELTGEINDFTHTYTVTFFADTDEMPDCDNDDCDGDTIPNDEEGTNDSDGDGRPDYYDSDSDNDEISDAEDNCRIISNIDQADMDGDGIGDLCDTENFCYFAKDQTRISDRSDIQGSVGSNIYVEIGGQAVVSGTVSSGDGVLLREDAAVNGAVLAGGSVSSQNGVSVSGGVIEGASVETVDIDEKTVNYSDNHVEVSSSTGCEATLSPGSYGRIAVRTGCALTLAGGAYDALEVNIEADSEIILLDAVELNTEVFRFGDRAAVTGISNPDSFNVYIDQSYQMPIGVDSDFIGHITAPHCEVSVFTGAFYEGCIHADRITIEADAQGAYYPDFDN